MSNLTKRALSNALMEVLKDKPFDKIKVQDLTSMCGLTRNTFYYHFKDIYDLLSYTFVYELEELEKKYNDNKNWEGGLEQGLNYIYQHRKAIRNIYESANQDIVIKYVMNISYEHAKAIVSLHANEELDFNIQNIIAKFYRDALLGALIDWLSSNMKSSPKVLARTYDTLFRGTFEATIKSASELQ